MVLQPAVSDSLLRVLEERADVSCLLDAELRFTYCNPAWDRFALENQGEPALGRHVLGTNFFAVVNEALERFYRRMFDAVLGSGQAFDFDYECSSAEYYRTFRMRVSPLNAPDGFMIVHSLRVEEPHTRQTALRSLDDYRDTKGVIVLCCHCRRARRAATVESWDWVPVLLNAGFATISHGLCRVCRVHYYPEIPYSGEAHTASN